MRILLKEVVLHLPDTVKAEPVGELNLFERVMNQLLFAVLASGTGKLMFIEESEPHLACSLPARPAGASRRFVAEHDCRTGSEHAADPCATEIFAVAPDSIINTYGFKF